MFLFGFSLRLFIFQEISQNTDFIIQMGIEVELVLLTDSQLVEVVI